MAAFPSGAGLIWPLPALVAWASAWLAWWLVARAGAGSFWALVAGLLVSAGFAWACCGAYVRRVIVATGFPLSLLMLGWGPDWPAWAWLLLALPLLVAYPFRAWRDAPWFPTPAGVLAELPSVVGPVDSILDAGCGVGHGLVALRRLWPSAQLQGVELSRPLAWLAAARCRDARILRADMWAVSWAAYDLIYVFQRPESMTPVWNKAHRELPAGAWLVSLEFAVPEQQPYARLCADGQWPVWVYRMPHAKHHSTDVGQGR